MSSRVAGVWNALGLEISSGLLPTGAVLTTEEVISSTGNSRVVVREALGRLVALGLLRVRRRIGYVVTPSAEWQRLAPDVVRWRLSGPDALRLAKELSALRTLLEPEAAACAAANGSTEQRQSIVSAGTAVLAGAINRDREAFLDADVRFHRLILDASGNDLFLALGGTLAEALEPRAGAVEDISLDAARAHVDLAEAIASSEQERARGLARRIAAHTS